MTTKEIEELVRQIMLGQTDIKKEGSIGGSGVFNTVDEAVCAAVNAQAEYLYVSLEIRRKIITSIREKMLPLVEELSTRTYEETGMGNIEDKIHKNRLAINQTPGVEDLITNAETGDYGMTLYEYSPYGVVGAIAPSTNPTETLISNTIGMLAAGNAVIFSPHPGAKNISLWLVKKLNEIVCEASGIDNLVVTVATPSIIAAQEMMNHPNVPLLVITGGPAVVNEAMRTGKKVIAAGAGNPPAIVDETANIKKAAIDIVDGASFDNNILCIAEKSVVAVDSIADSLIGQMEKAGAYLIKNPEDIRKLEVLCLTENNKPNKKFVGKNAVDILQAAGIQYTGTPRLIIVETQKNHYFAVEEMLMPILPIVRTPNFDSALRTALELEQGLHHTATMHSQSIANLNKAGRQLQTSIFVKNGPSFAGLGFKGEGSTTFTIATPTGEGTTTARHFARRRRCALIDGFSIR